MTTVRSRMINRVVIQRDSASVDSTIGAKGIPDWQTTYTNQPCFLSMFRVSRSGQEIIKEDKGLALAEMVLHLPLGLDINESDRILWIMDRQGNGILSGPLNIRSILPHHDHLELKLERASSGYATDNPEPPEPPEDEGMFSPMFSEMFA